MRNRSAPGNAMRRARSMSAISGGVVVMAGVCARRIGGTEPGVQRGMESDPVDLRARRSGSKRLPV